MWDASAVVRFVISRKEGICDQLPKKYYDRSAGKFRDASSRIPCMHFIDHHQADQKLEQIAKQQHGGIMQVEPVVVPE